MILANSADPDEMQYYAAFHLGLHCLLKYTFRVSSIKRVKIGIQHRYYATACTTGCAVTVYSIMHVSRRWVKPQIK